MLRKDWWHREYSQGEIAHKMGGGGQGWDHPTRQWLANYLPINANVLDVGCCNAQMLETAHNLNRPLDYTGVDQIEEFIEWNKEHRPEGKFLVSDASDLRDFEDNSFDFVVSRHVIDHLPYYSQHFTEMWRVAKLKVIVITWIQLFTTEGDDREVLQWGNEEYGGSWANRYNKKMMVNFIEHNLKPKKLEIIDEYENTGNSIIIMEKE